MTERSEESGQEQLSEDSANENDYAKWRQAENETARINQPPAKNLAGTQEHKSTQEWRTVNIGSGNNGPRR